MFRVYWYGYFIGIHEAYFAERNEAERFAASLHDHRIEAVEIQTSRA